ncbi:PRELI-like family-domain-containing protein [Catenaria anguillulae PL171]|uniref:PRELI-like family-domain-containing protein n=1 Tax=Catenaria anguillulae PL171 TaxID=765915 RepID=A0A1Y2HW90_9FUNG|nr:PRELI-like family-domain-containing protein [Catenaria anguillulae PL171]
MKFFTTTHEYNQPWSLVTSALWQKYPHHSTPHVLSVDVIDQQVVRDPSSGIVRLRTQRLLTIQQNVPRLLVKLFGVAQPTSHVLETSEVCPATAEFKSFSTNLAWRDMLVIDESMRYTSRPSSNSSPTTLCEHQVSITTGLSQARVRDYIEEALLKRIQGNVQLGRKALGEVMDRIAVAATVTASSSEAIATAAVSMTCE